VQSSPHVNGHKSVTSGLPHLASTFLEETNMQFLDLLLIKNGNHVSWHIEFEAGFLVGLRTGAGVGACVSFGVGFDVGFATGEEEVVQLPKIATSIVQMKRNSGTSSVRINQYMCKCKWFPDIV